MVAQIEQEAHEFLKLFARVEQVFYITASLFIKAGNASRACIHQSLSVYSLFNA